MFSYNSDYVIEIIPKNLGFFKKKKLIKEKLNQISEEKARVWVKDNMILWVFLKEDEQYWMPFEKMNFYLKLFNEEKCAAAIITEEEDGIINYYGVINGFLVAYNKDFDEVFYVMKNYASGKIQYFGVGKIERKCHKNLQSYQIAELINYQGKNNVAIDDEDSVFVNEDREYYEGFEEKKQFQLRDLFLDWFEKSNKQSFYLKNYLVKIFSIASILFFCLAIFFKKNNDLMDQKINLAMQKLLKNS